MTDIALIDNDTVRNQRLAEALSALGIRAHTYPTLQSFSTGSNENTHCIVVFENCLDKQLGSLPQVAPTIVLAEDPTVPQAVTAMREGAADYLAWPIDVPDLNAAIERCSLLAHNADTDTLAQFPLIGESPAMQMLRESIGKVGPTESSVLILGESGTGKELVARAIHASSNRAHTSLISLQNGQVKSEK